MQKYILASATLMAVTGSPAHAQAPANPSQGQYVAPYGSGPSANNNNNAWGIANTPSGSKMAGSLSTIFPPGTIKVPEPGTVVIRLNGRVEVEITANYTSVDSGVTAAGRPNGYKLNPVGVGSYMRLYPGFDGMAASGLRYGASVELRENQTFPDRSFASPAAGGAANSPGTNTNNESVFVRRAFAYLAADNVGILRLGQADGVIGLFDNCIFTTQCWDAGINVLNGTGGLQVAGPGAVGAVPFVWLAGAGAEYGNSKLVYLSPQFFGFDFGVQYAPNMGNSFQMSGTGVNCSQAGPTCINVSSGNDPTRWLNRVGTGLRYQQAFGPIDVKAYGFFETAGKEQLTTSPYSTTTQARLGTVINGVTSGTGTLRYDNLNFYKAGIALTAANFTLAADYVGGAVNGALSMRPSGGAPTNAVMAGLTYSSGPIVLGAQIGLIDTQGDARLTGVSQRHEYEVALGGTYKVAPGLQMVGAYTYIHRHQGGFDFAANALGTPGGATTAGTTTRDAQGQGFMFATVLTW